MLIPQLCGSYTGLLGVSQVPPIVQRINNGSQAIALKRTGLFSSFRLGTAGQGGRHGRRLEEVLGVCAAEQKRAKNGHFRGCLTPAQLEIPQPERF